MKPYDNLLYFTNVKGESLYFYFVNMEIYKMQKTPATELIITHILLNSEKEY